MREAFYPQKLFPGPAVIDFVSEFARLEKRTLFGFNLNFLPCIGVSPLIRPVFPDLKTAKTPYLHTAPPPKGMGDGIQHTVYGHGRQDFCDTVLLRQTLNQVRFCKIFFASCSHQISIMPVFCRAGKHKNRAGPKKSSYRLSIPMTRLIFCKKGLAFSLALFAPSFKSWFTFSGSAIRA